jgi:hypothetical protein
MPTKRAVLNSLPFALVLAVAAAGLLRIVLYHWREGATLIGAALLLAAALRAVLATNQAGLIAIRGRGVDVLLYASFGTAMVLVSLTITGGPFG